MTQKKMKKNSIIPQKYVVNYEPPRVKGKSLTKQLKEMKKWIMKN